MAGIALVLLLIAVVSVLRLSGAPMPTVDPVPEHRSTVEYVPLGSSGSAISITSSSTPLTITGNTIYSPNGSVAGVSPICLIGSTSTSNAVVPCVMEVR